MGLSPSLPHSERNLEVRNKPSSFGNVLPYKLKDREESLIGTALSARLLVPSPAAPLGGFCLCAAGLARVPRVPGDLGIAAASAGSSRLSRCGWRGRSRRCRQPPGPLRPHTPLRHLPPPGCRAGWIDSALSRELRRRPCAVRGAGLGSDASQLLRWLCVSLSPFPNAVLMRCGFKVLI